MENKTEYTPERIRELRALADRTMFRLQETITGDRKITMHIPARPNDDLDLLVGETKHQLKEALTEIERLQAESRTALSISATLADTGERLMQLAGEEFRADYARGILKTFRSAVVAIRELKHKETTNA